jgi:hypothetical protein
MAYDDRYERAMEFAEVATGLWDSWEADAFRHDKASGVFYDPDKLHTLDHRGKHFAVRGPLSVARTPQGRPVIVQGRRVGTGARHRGALRRRGLLGGTEPRLGAGLLCIGEGAPACAWAAGRGIADPARAGADRGARRERRRRRSTMSCRS